MAKQSTPVEIQTPRLIDWFRQQAKANGGVIPPFTNADVISELHDGAVKDEARAHGNVQSRVDFACYMRGLPPLGLTADKPFARAWGQQSRSWAFPIKQMQAAAQSHLWTDADFEGIEQEARNIPLRASDCWTPALARSSDSVKTWAESFGVTSANPRHVAPDANTVRITWTRDELILALQQYLKHGGVDLGEKHPEVVALSDFLNRLGAVLGTRGGAKFRNPNGVAMKLMNFRRHDFRFANAGSTGRPEGSQPEKPVWDEFASDPVRLFDTVNAIRAIVESYTGHTDLAGDDEPGIEEAAEGKLLTRLHRSRERSRKLVEQAKARALKQHGRLACAGCNFEFKAKYGFDAAHIIDCHHVKPVSTLATDGSKTHIDDLVLLCSNCHRVVHSRRPWLTVEQLHARIHDNAASA
jgi:predicted HNH restriction endonuclease